jgi:PAS domain S-box-containing protein
LRFPGVVIDITHRKQADEVERWLAAIIESSDDAIISKNLNGIITSWNRGAELLFGYRPEEVIGKSITILIPEDRQDEEPRILERLRRGERVDHFETIRRRKDGSLVEISLTISPVRDARGVIVGASKIARDISERKRAERLQETLVHELNHRVKNTLATVQAVARQSFRSSLVDSAARENFEARLHSLSNAHDLLTRENWDGAEMAAVVAQVLAPYPRQRFEIDGPKLRLAPNVALALTLALHELATNAVKYGALSVPSGRVAITWAIKPGDPPDLAFRWQEHGGPEVSPPTRKGFGSRLIERSLALELSGEVAITYDRAGVVCDVRAPVSNAWTAAVEAA